MNEWLELAIKICTILGAMYAVKRWYDNRLRDIVDNTSTTQATRLIVNELTKTVQNIEDRVSRLEMKQDNDVQMHNELKQLIQEFLLLKGQFKMLYSFLMKNKDKE